MLRILSFDTSNNAIYVALLSFDQQDTELGVSVVAQAEVEESTEDKATRQQAVSVLTPTVQRLFEEANWQRDSLSFIAVGVGPGGFTGVRTSVVTARTLAQALKVGVVGVSILSVYSRAGRVNNANGADSGVILGADRESFFVFAPGHDPALVKNAQILEFLPLCSSWTADEKSLQRLSSISSESDGPTVPFRLEPLPKVKNIAVNQASIAVDLVSLNYPNASQADILARFPYEKVEPLYLRSPSITLKKTSPA